MMSNTRMPFQLPDTFAPRRTPLAGSTVKVYTGRLNTLSKMKFGDTPDELKKNHKTVIKYLKDMNDGSENAKMRVRGMLTAIFWVMPEEYTKSHNPYYKFYQKVLPGAAGDSKWVPRKDYVAPEAPEAPEAIE